MIRVTRLDRQEIALNSDLIETVESRPDTTIRLVTGLHLVVREPLEEILERIRAWRASLAERGAPAALHVARVPLAALPPEPLALPEEHQELLEIPRVKKLDIGTIAGLGCAFGLILLGNHMEGGHVSAILQPTAALIVFGGTLGATMVGFPLHEFIRAVRSVAQFFGDRGHDSAALLAEIVRYAQIARREGIIALEEHVQKSTDPFFKKAFLMVVDGIDSKTIAETLELELTELDAKGEVPAKVFEAAGGYCPTIGILGAVLGLIHVMSNLSDIEKVGSGIAVAFVATIYGVGAANIVLLPASSKLKMKHRQEMVLREMIMHGAISIQQGENPKLIEGKLSVFVHDNGAKRGAGGKARAAA